MLKKIITNCNHPNKYFKQKLTKTNNSYTHKIYNNGNILTNILSTKST